MQQGQGLLHKTGSLFYVHEKIIFNKACALQANRVVYKLLYVSRQVPIISCLIRSKSNQLLTCWWLKSAAVPFSHGSWPCLLQKMALWKAHMQANSEACPGCLFNRLIDMFHTTAPQSVSRPFFSPARKFSIYLGMNGRVVNPTETTSLFKVVTFCDGPIVQSAVRMLIAFIKSRRQH